MSREIDYLARRILEMAGEGPAIGKFKKKGWQQAGELFVGQAQPVSMQFDFGDPDSYTIGFLPPFAFGNDGCVRCEALIMWNVDGSYKPCRVSVVGGMSITGVAQGVKIIMKDATPTNQGYCPANTKYSVSAQVARGTRGTSVASPYYIPIGLDQAIDLPAHSISTQPIPYDAGVQTFYLTVTQAFAGGTSPAVGDVLVTQQADSPNNSNAFVANVGTFDPVRFQGWVPIMPGCNTIAINNTSGNHYEYTLVFGVDG